MSSEDSPSAVMLRQVTEFTETETRYRRIRCFLIAFFFGLTLSLLIYLLLSWEVTENSDENPDTIERDTASFTVLVVISVCIVVIGSVTSFVILEVVRRRAIHKLTCRQNAVLRRYFDERGSVNEPTNGSSTTTSVSVRTSWTGHASPSVSSLSSMTPPPAYEELVERGEFKAPSPMLVY